MPDKSTDQGVLSQLTRINLIILCTGFLFFCLLTVVDFLTSVAGLVAGSLIVAYLLLGPVQFIESWLPKLRIPPHLHRTVAIIAVYLIFAGVIAVALIRVIPTLSLQVKEFAHDIPTYISRMDTSQNAAPNGNKHLPELMKTHREGAAKTIQTPQTRQSRIVRTATDLALDKLAALYKRYATRAGSLLLDIGTSTLTGLVYMLTTLVLVFILLHDGAGLKRGLVDLMPLHMEAPLAEFLERMHLQLYSFVKAQVLMSLISGSLIYLILHFLHIKYALLLGTFFGLVSILPVIGPWLGLIPISLILAFTGHLTYILQVLLFTGLFYLVKTYWLWPKLADRRFDIHPIIFILTFVVCLKLVGYLGILLSFPLASLLGVWFETMKANRSEAEQQTLLPLDT